MDFNLYFHSNTLHTHTLTGKLRVLWRFKEKMSGSLKPENPLEGELTCTVCLDIFRDPYLLPCGHNFCWVCVRDLKQQGGRGKFSCPDCRQEWRPDVRLQKNYKLANIAEDYRKRSRSAKQDAVVLCDICPGQTAAVKTCLKCEVSMCPDHVKPHLERLAFRDHPLTEPLKDIQKRKCPEHDEMLKYYCTEKKEYVCSACTIEGKHAEHTVKFLKNMEEGIKESSAGRESFYKRISLVHVCLLIFSVITLIALIAGLGFYIHSRSEERHIVLALQNSMSMLHKEISALPSQLKDLHSGLEDLLSELEELRKNISTGPEKSSAGRLSFHKRTSLVLACLWIISLIAGLGL